MKNLITLIISILIFSIGYSQTSSSKWETINSVIITDANLNTEIKIPTSINIRVDTNPIKIFIYTTPLTIITSNLFDRTIKNGLTLYTGTGIDQNHNSVYVLISFIANTNKMTAVAVVYDNINYIYQIKQ